MIHASQPVSDDAIECMGNGKSSLLLDVDRQVFAKATVRNLSYFGGHRIVQVRYISS